MIIVTMKRCLPVINVLELIMLLIAGLIGLPCHSDAVIKWGFWVPCARWNVNRTGIDKWLAVQKIIYHIGIGTCMWKVQL